MLIFTPPWITPGQTVTRLRIAPAPWPTAASIAALAFSTAARTVAGCCTGMSSSAISSPTIAAAMTIALRLRWV